MVDEPEKLKNEMIACKKGTMHLTFEANTRSGSQDTTTVVKGRGKGEVWCLGTKSKLNPTPYRYLAIAQTDIPFYGHYLRICRNVVAFEAFRVMSQKHNGPCLLLIKPW